MAIDMNLHNIEQVSFGDDPLFDEAILFFRKNILNELNQHNIDCWLAGGCVREYFLNKAVTCDFDLYFSSEENFNKAKLYYTDRQKSKTIFDYFRNDDSVELGKIVYENHNSCKIEYGGKHIDLVKAPRTNPEETIRRFDFTICSASVSYNQVVMWPKYFQHLLNKKLIIKNFRDPISTLQRVARYIPKGYTIDKQEMFELAKQIKKTPMGENYLTDFFESNENPNGTVKVGRNGFLKQNGLVALEDHRSGYDSDATAGTSGTAVYVPRVSSY